MYPPLYIYSTDNLGIHTSILLGPILLPTARKNVLLSNIHIRSRFERRRDWKYRKIIWTVTSRNVSFRQNCTCRNGQRRKSKLPECCTLYLYPSLGRPHWPYRNSTPTLSLTNCCRAAATATTLNPITPPPLHNAFSHFRCSLQSTLFSCMHALSHNFYLFYSFLALSSLVNSFSPRM